MCTNNITYKTNSVSYYPLLHIHVERVIILTCSQHDRGRCLFYNSGIATSRSGSGSCRPAPGRGGGHNHCICIVYCGLVYEYVNIRAWRITNSKHVVYRYTHIHPYCRSTHRHIQTRYIHAYTNRL